MMSIDSWIKENTHDLCEKTVVITGSTGGIGQELCMYLASLGAKLVLVDRDPTRSQRNRERIISIYPRAEAECITADLEDMGSVKAAVKILREIKPYALIHNAGAYSIPRHKCSTGLDNVFQINFASPYYITKELLPILRENGGRVIAVGSVAHNYSKTDPRDTDFSTRTKSSLVYGNAKRYLMFALHELFRNETQAHLAVTHPGITFTNITAHYPKLIFAVIKHPMKVIFMKPKKACLSILAGMFDSAKYGEWIGPAFFDVWGYPKKRMLHTVSAEESRRIFETAERIYGALSENTDLP